ncbi:MAG: dihydrofolate reductase family protein [Propionibacteriaceae bacterium]|jgi:2,5-diamino-6-(ribosylamino)-4(3H)-pyrimidinone 5'-phosphate reductase|nr:dihydrofolate reductase family protein [Propionibacteriaceae bacterium]
MGNRPVTTLFMLASLDGKISPGASAELDFDRDFPQLDGLSQGLQQYYEIERTTDLWSLNSGLVQAKMGVNDKPLPAQGPVSFVTIDNRWLTERGVLHLCALAQRHVLVTTNPDHPACSLLQPNLSVIYQTTLDLRSVLEILHRDHGCTRITVQSGGTLNGLFLRQKLLDYVDIVIAPVLVGGRDTPTLVDGAALTSPAELGGLGVLALEQCDKLNDSYVRLRYKVVG